MSMTPANALAFFASVIKSGEPWTPSCQQAYDEAMSHLTQPAQSVAIYPVGHFIETSAGEYGRVSREHECDGDVFQLYRSTGNAQSVDVRNVVLKSLGGYLERHWPDNPVSYDDMADAAAAALQEKGNG